MLAIASGFLEHEEWHYENHDRTIQVHENEILGILANGLFIPDRRVNGVQHAPEYDPNAPDIGGLDTELTEDEKAFIDEHKDDRPKKIEVEDESEGEQKVDVKGGNKKR